MLHPVFTSFNRWTGESDGRFHVDFLGVKTDPKYWPDIRPSASGAIEGDYPKTGPQLYEWVAVLTAALEAHDKFVMAEIGAGYGAWIVRAGVAVRQIQDIPIHLIAVEGHALHYRWMREHFENNNLDPASHQLIYGVVAPEAGEFEFLETTQENMAYDSHLSGRTLHGFGSGRLSKTRGYTLDEVLDGHDVVDLVHMDIQGAEREVIKASIDVLSEKVRVLCVGTHSEIIDQELLELLSRSGWIPRWVYPRHSTWATFWGIISFADGCHVWINRRFPEA